MAPICAAESQLEDEDYVPDLPTVNTAKKIIKYYSRPYQPDLYPNPALNFHYETLAALALNQSLPEQVDKTVPAYRLIDKRVGDDIQALKKELGIDEAGDDEEEEVKPGKRARGASEDEMRRWAGVLGDKGEKKITLEVSLGLF